MGNFEIFVHIEAKSSWSLLLQANSEDNVRLSHIVSISLNHYNRQFNQNYSPKDSTIFLVTKNDDFMLEVSNADDEYPGEGFEVIIRMGDFEESIATAITIDNEEELINTAVNLAKEGDYYLAEKVLVSLGYIGAPLLLDFYVSTNQYESAYRLFHNYDQSDFLSNDHFWKRTSFLESPVRSEKEPSFKYIGFNYPKMVVFVEILEKLQDKSLDFESMILNTSSLEMIPFVLHVFPDLLHSLLSKVIGSKLHSGLISRLAGCFIENRQPQNAVRLLTAASQFDNHDYCMNRVLFTILLYQRHFHILFPLIERFLNDNVKQSIRNVSIAALSNIIFEVKSFSSSDIPRNDISDEKENVLDDNPDLYAMVYTIGLFLYMSGYINEFKLFSGLVIPMRLYSKDYHKNIEEFIEFDRAISSVCEIEIDSTKKITTIAIGDRSTFELAYRQIGDIGYVVPHPLNGLSAIEIYKRSSISSAYFYESIENICLYEHLILSIGSDDLIRVLPSIHKTQGIDTVSSFLSLYVSSMQSIIESIVRVNPRIRISINLINTPPNINQDIRNQMNSFALSSFYEGVNAISNYNFIEH